MDTPEIHAPFIQHEPSKLAEALAKAQGQFRTPTLNRTAKIMKEGKLLYVTNYADLEECIDCIRKPLADNGLSFVQAIEFLLHPKEMWVLKLMLRHGSGERMESVLPLNVTATPQQLGGSLTYFKRYQLSAFFGLAADFDDDGNAAEDKGNKVEGTPKPKFTPPPKPREEDISQVPMTPLDQINKWAKDTATPAEVIKSIMKRTLGHDKKSTECTNDELTQVLNYLKMMK